MGTMTGNGGESTMRKIEHSARSAGDKAEAMFEDVKDVAMDYGGKVGGLVKDHPIPAILTGIGIGFLIGRLLSR